MTTRKQKRGELTDHVKEVSKKLLGYEISKTELRFLPYIQYELMNSRKLDQNKISLEEREIWLKWQEKGYVSGGVSGMSVSEGFWGIMCKILWTAYVDLRD